jgi:hypothetical protein
MSIQVRFRQELNRRGISAYRIVQETKGRVNAKAIYGLARSEHVKRLDLETLAAVMAALEKVSGEPVALSDLLEVTPEASDVVLIRSSLEEPDLVALTAKAAKAAKVSVATGKPKGSSQPVTIRGVGPSVVEIIRDGRR